MDVAKNTRMVQTQSCCEEIKEVSFCHDRKPSRLVARLVGKHEKVMTRELRGIPATILQKKSDHKHSEEIFENPNPNDTFCRI